MHPLWLEMRRFPYRNPNANALYEAPKPAYGYRATLRDRQWVQDQERD